MTNIRTFIDPVNPKRVGFTCDASDMDKLMQFLQSPAAAESMESDGVVQDTVVMLVEA